MSWLSESNQTSTLHQDHPLCYWTTWRHYAHRHRTAHLTGVRPSRCHTYGALHCLVASNHQEHFLSLSAHTTPYTSHVTTIRLTMSWLTSPPSDLLLRCLRAHLTPFLRMWKIDEATIPCVLGTVQREVCEQWSGHRTLDGLGPSSTRAPKCGSPQRHVRLGTSQRKHSYHRLASPHAPYGSRAASWLRAPGTSSWLWLSSSFVLHVKLAAAPWLGFRFKIVGHLTSATLYSVLQSHGCGFSQHSVLFCS